MFDKITSFEQLVKAFYKARRGKRDRIGVAQYEYFLEKNILKLQKYLLSGKYYPQQYSHFTIFEPKTRNISAPAFTDRIVQHSIVAQIEPIFEKQFIFDSYACRKYKGTHFGAQRIKKFLMAARCIHGKEAELYVMQCDIHKYFHSVDWDVLLSILQRTIRCEKTYELIRRIVVTHKSNIDQKSQEETKITCQANLTNNKPKQLALFETSHPNPVKNQDATTVSTQQRKGLPIGNLTSQLFANIYLNELDQYVKHTLKQRWYARYMDDFLIIHHDRKKLKQLEKTIQDFLKSKLGLKLHPKKNTIKNVRDGVPFVGYRIFYDHILVRGDTLRHMQRKYRKRQKQLKNGYISESDLSQSKAAIKGHLDHANAYLLYHKLVDTD